MNTQTTTEKTESPLPVIEPHQYEWILTTAAEHYEREAAKMELEAVRHNEYMGIPWSTPYLGEKGEPQSRSQRVVVCQRWAREYNQVAAYCRAAIKVVQRANYEGTGADIVAAVKAHAKQLARKHKK